MPALVLFNKKEPMINRSGKCIRYMAKDILPKKANNLLVSIFFVMLELTKNIKNKIQESTWHCK